MLYKGMITVTLILAITFAHAHSISYLSRLNRNAGHMQINMEIKFYNQSINHDDPALGTFLQRYFVDTSFSESNQSPVFFFICGESECALDSPLYGYLWVLAQKYHAKVVGLEHRYYGKSIPNNNLSVDNMKYLTTWQALKDLTSFQLYMMSEQHWEGKWI